MTYEEFLDEVTTLIVEKYDLENSEAIQLVMSAQADDFFSIHDDDPTICTLDRAHLDAAKVFKIRENFSQRTVKQSFLAGTQIQWAVS